MKMMFLSRFLPASLPDRRQGICHHIALRLRAEIAFVADMGDAIVEVPIAAADGESRHCGGGAGRHGSANG